jgi:ADP-heptose:LPS heptosyltransferase
LSILETAEVIRRASLFIGVDSGPAHMANAMGTPGVVLLGRYEAFDQYMPYTGRFAREEAARVIQWPEPAREIPVDHVFDAATSLCPAKVLAA